MSDSLVSVLRSMPVVLQGVSRDGSERIIGVISRAQQLPPEAFRSPNFDGGSIRKELRIVAALLPHEGTGLVRAMWMLVANRNADWDDVAALVEDRKGETRIDDLREIVAGLRAGLTASDVHERVGVALGKVQEVSMFLGTRDARTSVIRAAAIGFASAEMDYLMFAQVNGFESRDQARESYWRALIGAHRMLTPFDEAALGFVDPSQELAEMCSISKSRARKYLSEARTVVEELQSV